MLASSSDHSSPDAPLPDCATPIGADTRAANRSSKHSSPKRDLGPSMGGNITLQSMIRADNDVALHAHDERAGPGTGFTGDPDR